MTTLHTRNAYYVLYTPDNQTAFFVGSSGKYTFLRKASVDLSLAYTAHFLQQSAVSSQQSANQFFRIEPSVRGAVVMLRLTC